MSSASRPGIQASDSVALAVESHVRNMEADGYGDYSIRKECDEIVVHFGPVEVRGENCDIALLRLANALLDDAKLSRPFLVHLRNPAENPPATALRDNRLKARKTAERR